MSSPDISFSDGNLEMAVCFTLVYLSRWTGESRPVEVTVSGVGGVLVRDKVKTPIGMVMVSSTI